MLGRGVTAADRWNVRVVSIDFSLAPRRNFDEITDECAAAVSALVEQGIPLKDIAFYGDSAGGSLAAAVILKMRDRGLAEIPSTRLLVATALLMRSGIAPADACRAAFAGPLTDDPEVLGAILDVVAATFP